MTPFEIVSTTVDQKALSVPPKTQEVYGLIEHFRKINHADKLSGFKLCRAINLGIIKYLKTNFPEIECSVYYCQKYPWINRSMMPCEHFIGAIKTSDGYLWFDGTADQLNLRGFGKVFVQMVEKKEDIIPSITATLGGKWEVPFINFK